MADDLDAWLDGYQPVTASVVLYQRGDLAAEHTRLETDLAQVGLTGQSDDDGHIERARDLARRLQQVEADLEASKKTFWFASVSWTDWYRMIAEHPPTETEREEGHREEVSGEFWVHAIAACSTEPKLTVAQVRKLRDTRAADFDQFRAAVQRVNESQVVTPKSPMATAVAKLLDASSTPPKSTGSRSRSGRVANGKASRSTATTKTAG